MKLRYPLYYKKFSCIAHNCSDNCCIGWEIDIDSDTEEYYRSVEGSFGKRLRENIENGSFRLCGERCPFLNEKNLCDIIINLGEEHLCHICDRHPRYFGWYGSVKEAGIGLSCEEAARLILTEGNTSFAEEDIPNEETDETDPHLQLFLENARKQIFDLLEKDIPFAQKVSSLISYAEELQDCLDFGIYVLPVIEEHHEECSEADLNKFVSAFSRFEPIDSVWSDCLTSLRDKKPCVNADYLSNILIYFIWRYFMQSVFDGDALSKIYIAVIGALMISLMANGDDLSSYIEASKLYSKEMDYCEENMELLSALIYEEYAFSAESLLAICNML